jgi:hypothetical protein
VTKFEMELSRTMVAQFRQLEREGDVIWPISDPYRSWKWEGREEIQVKCTFPDDPISCLSGMKVVNIKVLNFFVRRKMIRMLYYVSLLFTENANPFEGTCK